jgi:hypothetical protein
MAPVTFDERPRLDPKTVRAWPRPRELGTAGWSRWSYEERESWLIRHAFVEVPDGAGTRWEQRSGVDTTTASQVVEAATVAAGVKTIGHMLMDGVLEGLRDSCLVCGTEMPPDANYCPECGKSPEYSDDTAESIIVNGTFLFGLALFAVVFGLLAISLFGGSDTEGSVSSAANPSGDLVEQPAEDAVPIPDEAEAPAVDPTPDAPAALSEAVDPLAAAAGTYRLNEASARAAMEQVVTSLDAASGVIEIGSDGEVSGSIEYDYVAPMGGNGADDPGFPARVDFVGILVVDPIETVAGVPGRFGFEGTLEVALLIEPSTGEPPPFVTEVVLEVAGEVDAGAGTIRLTQAGDSGSVLFER